MLSCDFKGVESWKFRVVQTVMFSFLQNMQSQVGYNMMLAMAMGFCWFCFDFQTKLRMISWSTLIYSNIMHPTISHCKIDHIIKSQSWLVESPFNISILCAGAVLLFMFAFSWYRQQVKKKNKEDWDWDRGNRMSNGEVTYKGMGIPP